MLTQEELKKYLSYENDTGFFRWVISVGRKIKKGRIAGHKKSNGYVNICINGELYKAHRLAWLYVYGYFPENDIDHKDRVTGNNKIENLREVSRQCNCRNSSVYKNNKSCVTGVHWSEKRGLWVASIRVKTKGIFLGRFSDLLDAVSSRYKAELLYNWPDCDTRSTAKIYLQSAGLL